MTVPVWHNPRATEACACRDHLTAPPGVRDVQRPDRTVALLCTLAVLAAVGFIVSYVTIPANASIFVFPIGTVQALHFALGMTLSLALSCLGAGARRWAHGQMSQPSADGSLARRTGRRIPRTSPSARSAVSGPKP
ncbi:hypothetical protein [Streptomyces acidicola]|uniref:hypothetical protein n=1 Tax=Streptomyces acidicola TaxID=2596892 RepID=UPI0034333B19